MSVDSKVSIFTTAMRAEFVNAWQATAEPAAWEKFVQVVPSTARIEHYNWMSPSPGIQKFAGHRRYGKIETLRYSIENKEFDASFEVLLRDIEDDQTGGYLQKPKELAMRAKLFPGRWSIKTLALGTSTPGFDGSNFFANSHNLGTGDNLLDGNSGSGNSDGLTYTMAALYVGGPLKPLLWQSRKPPRFMSSAGETRSFESKTVRYWIDMEGESLYGYWWDSVLYKWTNLPTVTEFHSALQAITAAFRGFQLPKSATSDDGEYPHEQSLFNDQNLIIVGTAGLERVAAQALNQEWVPVATSGAGVAATNLYYKYATFIPTNFI